MRAEVSLPTNNGVVGLPFGDVLLVELIDLGWDAALCSVGS